MTPQIFVPGFCVAGEGDVQGKRKKLGGFSYVRTYGEAESEKLRLSEAHKSVTFSIIELKAPPR